MKSINLENEILNIISNSPIKSDLIHAKSTREIVLLLNPSADYALQIAALAHDIERGVSINCYNNNDKFNNYNKYKQIHSEKSAKIITNLLKKYKFDKEFISKVNHLVLSHEIGGNNESNILMEADSISFFKDNIKLYYKDNGKEKTIKKINFMYNRVSDKAKNLIKKIKFNDINIKNICNF